MRFVPTPLAGAFVIELDKRADERGFFARFFCEREFGEARKLLAEKALFRSVELAATERHLDRLREGRPGSIETTSLHLVVLRDLRRIHSHICSVAYPVLDAAGEFAELQSTERGPIELPSTTTHPSVSNVGHS